MEVIKNITSIILLLILSACSNTPERETGELKLLICSVSSSIIKINQMNLSTRDNYLLESN